MSPTPTTSRRLTSSPTQLLTSPPFLSKQWFPEDAEYDDAALDTIHHDASWRAHKTLCQKVSDQSVTVMTHIESDDFPDSEGTEQEDPSSSLLFNSVLSSNVETKSQFHNKNEQTRWKTEKWEDDLNEFVRMEKTEESKGNDLKNDERWRDEQGHCISNLRYCCRVRLADDVLLLSITLSQLKKTMTDYKRSTDKTNWTQKSFRTPNEQTRISASRQHHFG